MWSETDPALLDRCRQHARFLDDCGLDGDGQDVRELIGENAVLNLRVTQLRRELALRTILLVIAVAAIVVLSCSSTASSQETHSVLLNPPAAVVQQPALAPQPPKNIIVLQRGLFGWRAKPMTLVPATPVVVAKPKKPVVVWTPQVIWR
jgi:hypothetical protein